MLYKVPMLRRAGSLLLLAATALASGVAVARLPQDLDAAVVTRHHHGADPLQTAVLLRFGVSSLLFHAAPYFHPPLLYPDPNPLRGTEPLVAEAVLAVPFRLALGDRPAAVYTCVKIATLALLAFATGLLLRELGVRLALCLVAASLSVTVSTTTVFVDRLQAVSLQWLPLALLFALRYWRGGRVVDAVAFGASAFLAAQASLYTDVMLVAAAPFLAPALWPPLRGGGSRRRLAPLAVAAVLAAAASAWLLRPYLADRADVAAYSTADYASEKSWNPFHLADPVTSPPEYPPRAWRLAPPASWDGLYPGTAFVLFACAAVALSALDVARRRSAAAGGVPFASRILLAVLLGALLAGLGAAAWTGRSRLTDLVVAGALWGALLTWCVRLLRWPSPGDDSERLRFVASTAGLAAFVFLLLSLGSPIRLLYFGEPLAEGLFRPLSGVLPPLRELRELKRFLLPAGWAGIVAGAAVLELRLRALPRAVGPALATALLAVGFAERADADTRKASLPPLPAGYGLLGRSTRVGGLLELPFDEWGRIASIHRMLWQPLHGRPIVAGKTGLDPAWYSPARAVFNAFPSEETLLLLRAWGIDSVLDMRGEAEPATLDGVELRGRVSGERGEWRLYDVLPEGAAAALEEPAVAEGSWESPLPEASDAQAAALATDGSSETAAAVSEPEGLRVGLPAGRTATAVELDYGNGRFARVPGDLRVLGRGAGGEWLDVTDAASARHLRARAANQLLQRRAARLVVLLRPSDARELRLVSSEAPWDLPELRVRLAPAKGSALSEAR